MKQFIVTVFIIGCLFSLAFARDNYIKPGIVITEDNYQRYLPQLKQLLPITTFTHFLKGIENGWITMPIAKKGNYIPMKGFENATLENSGKYRVGEGNELIGPRWTGGLPFPQPKNGAELGWNAFYRKTAPEEFQSQALYMLFEKTGEQERSFTVNFFKKYYMGRTDTPPIPELPGNKGIIIWKESMLVLEPLDVKGFSMIRIHYTPIEQDDDVYSYIPALRRIRRLTGGDMCDPVLGSDQVYDDFEMWHQKIGPKMTFKGTIIEKNLLVPREYTTKLPPPGDFVKKSCYQVDWEIRTVWILEIDMNDTGYCYSRRVMYIDKDDGHCTSRCAENYDQKGRLWRGAALCLVEYKEPKTRWRNWYGAILNNHITGHSSVPWMHPIDYELSKVRIPFENFTVKGLLRRAR